jgi:hypothetical protein
LVDDRFVKKAIAGLGGMTAFGLPEGFPAKNTSPPEPVTPCRARPRELRPHAGCNSMNATSIPLHRSSARIGLSLLGLFVLLVLWSLGVRAR